MTYKVLVRFADMQDGNFVYEAGDEFPRQGLKPSEARIAELASRANRRGIPLIAKAEAEPKDVPEVKKEKLEPPKPKKKSAAKPKAKSGE